MFEPFWEALCPHFVDLGVKKGFLGCKFSIVFVHLVFDIDFGPFFAKKNKKNEK